MLKERYSDSFPLHTHEASERAPAPLSCRLSLFDLRPKDFFPLPLFQQRRNRKEKKTYSFYREKSKAFIVALPSFFLSVFLLSYCFQKKYLRELPAVGDDDLLRRRARAAAVRLDLLDDVHAVGDAAEDDVLAVEPRGLDGAEEELCRFLFWFFC